MNFKAKVADIRLESRVGLAAIWLMSLDTNEFVPGDTGTLEAVTRSGTRLAIPVSAAASDKDGVIWLTVEKPLAAGTDITAEVVGR
jgi:hypothetical protein